MATIAEFINELDTATFEDSKPINKILAMILDRASLVSQGNRNAIQGFNIDPWYRGYDYSYLDWDELKKLGEWVKQLAPKFIDMEYPYWNGTWSTFPQYFSADQIAKDEDHSLNTLPTKMASFDDDSVELFRNYLKNIVYWLSKFRCIVSNRSQYNQALQRDWSWWKEWISWDQDWTITAYENNQSTQKSLGELESGGDGTIRSSNSGFAPFYVDCSVDIHFDKAYSHGRNTALSSHIDEDYVFSITWVPDYVRTPNPAGIPADLYWYFVPGRHYSNWWKEENLHYLLELDNGWTVTWGDNNQFSAVQYDSTKGESKDVYYTTRKGQFTEESYTLSNSDEYIRRLTNWSEDGSRSCVVLNEEEEGSPNTGNSIIWGTRDEYKFPHWFGVGDLSENTPPRYKAATIQPHDSYTLNVCTLTSIPTMSDLGISFPTPIWDSDSYYKYGIHSICWRTYDCTTRWYPVLDYGEVVVPSDEEEEPEEEPGE